MMLKIGKRREMYSTNLSCARSSVVVTAHPAGCWHTAGPLLSSLRVNSVSYLIQTPLFLVPSDLMF